MGFFKSWLALDDTASVRTQLESTPEHSRPLAAVSALRDAFETIDTGNVSLQEEGSMWTWTMQRSPTCWNVPGGQAAFMIGLLQGLLAWSSDDQLYYVIERECVNQGQSACRIRIEPKPPASSQPPPTGLKVIRRG
jgi:hypothetical protein